MYTWLRLAHQQTEESQETLTHARIHTHIQARTHTDITHVKVLQK